MTPRIPTAGPGIEGRTISQHRGIVTGEAILGASLHWPATDARPLNEAYGVGHGERLGIRRPLEELPRLPSPQSVVPLTT